MIRSRSSTVFGVFFFLACYGVATIAQEASNARALSKAFRNAAKIATPSVVTIISFGQKKDEEGAEVEADDFGVDDDNEGTDEGEDLGNEELLPASSIGSGLIFSSDGLIITNTHVVRDAGRVVVRLHDGLEIVATDVVVDPASDIGILKIETDEELVPARIGDSKNMEIGEWVLAIGSPFRLDATVSAGIISATGRKLAQIRRGRLLQTDAAINPGNSGGPLVNLDGEVVGISTAIATRSGSYQGIGFAVPIHQAQWIANELAEHGEVRRASIGVALTSLNPRIAKQIEVPMKKGILIVSVTKERAAEKAGAKPLDVILEFNGEKIFKPRELQEAIEREPIGSEQTLKVFREGEELELKVTLEAVQ